MFNIVLLEPEIPANTGNIGRTCLVTGSALHLIEPMGFIINDRNLKRAGMDYWHELDVTVYDSWRDFVRKNAGKIAFSDRILESVGEGCPTYADGCLEAEPADADGRLEAEPADADGSLDVKPVNADDCLDEKPADGGTPADAMCVADAGSRTDAVQVTDGGRKATLWMATTKALKIHSQADFKDGDYIMFGKESAGIPEEILLESPETCIRIPMAKSQRSLNLSNSAAVVLYEALRQNDYLDLELTGQLHRHSWEDAKYFDHR